jgi:hypothetical protein
MASVWRVVDEVSGRALALKRLSRKANARHVALFEREYHTLASVRHPSLVEAYDYGSDERGPFYTMELLDGSDVSRLAPMPWEMVCRVLRDVASGLALMHARRLVHRDVSARNAWRMPDGRTKLIDFGTMTTFGKPADVAGTAPFVAPEAMRGLDLDQRTDLYALGALGYYLLTGRHAYPARSFGELESVWNERPRPVWRRVAELERDDLGPVPPALDALIDGLLSHDPLARPTTAADVIDRLRVIASLEPDTGARALESYLSSPHFVGRGAERSALTAALAAASAGKAASVIVEGASGLGRTRLLRELAIEARLAGAVVLQGEPQASRDTLSVGQDFGLRLLAAAPAAAFAAAARYARTLGHVSSALRARLKLTLGGLAEMPQAHGEARMRVQTALRDWFLDFARHDTLVLLADDLEGFDEASAAWLAALAREAGQHRLLVVAAHRSDGGEASLAVQALRQNATRLVLQPFAAAETAQLFRSVFGEVAHLGRFVDLVHQRTEGNPGHSIDVAEHLSRDGVIAYAEGTWVLPQSFAADALPVNREGADVARVGRLSSNARSLGQALSLREGPITFELCAVLAEGDRQHLFAGLEDLVREGILVGAADGYRFARESLRSLLKAELADDRRRVVHGRLGKYLLASEDLSELDRLRAGVHLLLGGEEEAGSVAVAAAGQHYGLVQLADLGPAAPSLEEALTHFRSAGRSPHEMASLLAPLALAGYYADRRLAGRYGEEAVDVLQTIVGLKRARRLRPYLGRKLGLFVALGLAAVAFALRRRNTRVPAFRDAIMLLFNCVAALTGVCTICIDPEGGRKYGAVLEPMTALGPHHVATFMHDFCMNLVATVEDRLGEARDRWSRMIERLDRPDAVRNLPPHVHNLYLGGALYARGVTETWRDDSQALEYAERLDGLRLKLYEMSADQVRMMYYANRGDLELFEKYRGRVEVHAIQRGTAWQVETWTHSGLITVYVRTRDVARLKECAEQLKRMSAELPSLRFAHTRALGAYLVLRGSPREALEVLGVGERPLALVGWGRGEGLRARAHNALGEYELAQQVCDDATAHLTEEDLKFCALNLGLQIERARAMAGRGEFGAAEEALQALLSAHESGGNPLTVGALHEAFADLASMRGDRPEFAEHLVEVDRWFRQTRNPALVARYEQLAREAVRASMMPGGAGDDGQPEALSHHLMTFVHRLRHGGERTLTRSAEWALHQLSQFADLREGYLFVRQDGEPVCLAHVGDDRHREALGRWVAERLLAGGEEFSTVVATSTADGTTDPNRLDLDGEAFRFTPLLLAARGDEDDSREPVGALVLSGDTSVPFAVIRTIAERLLAVTESRC